MSREIQDGNNTLTYVLPDVVDPSDTICVTLRIPNNKFHIMAFKGAVWDLCNWWNWERDDAHTATRVAQVWRRVFRSMKFDSCAPAISSGTLVEVPNLMSDLVQVICDENGKCILQYRCDICSPWQTVANLSDLNTNPSGTGNQPTPGGGTASDCVTIYCNQTYAIPIPVNTGDKIEITSATGKWSDQFARWLCIDGNLFFVDCTGIGGASGGAGDVVPSANHLSLVVQFSTGYYALYPGASLIVPGGVVSEQPTLLANKPTVNSGDGWIDICWKVTNNSAVTFSHTFDLTTNPGGWHVVPTEGGHWQPGVGFVSDLSVPADGDQITIGLTALPARTYLSWAVTVVCTDNTNQAGDFYQNGVNTDSIPTSVGTHVYTPSHAPIAGNDLTINLSNRPSAAVAEYTITKVVITGNGTDPF